jgi:predicted metal-dependent HD superfamily phosphohydrolase
MATREQWDALWKELGAVAPAGVYEEVVARYAEPHRHYHTARHLDECFAELTAVRADATHPGEVELALWFHDAIYEPRRHDNEQRSADWAREVVARAGLDASVSERVATLIMATRHDAEPTGRDAGVLVDVDLSILGAEPARFDEYERDVRAEYGWVPEALFRRERRKILQRLLERERIYNTPRMRESHEPRARANLARSLATLAPPARRRLPITLALAVVAIGMAGFFVENPLWGVFAVAGAVVLFYELRRP